MKVLSEIPRSLQGRGFTQSWPIECGCGETFLFPANRGRTVTCPTCKAQHIFTEDDALLDSSHNGQAV
jgi:hypothetical protein